MRLAAQLRHLMRAGFLLCAHILGFVDHSQLRIRVPTRLPTAPPSATSPTLSLEVRPDAKKRAVFSSHWQPHPLPPATTTCDHIAGGVAAASATGQDAGPGGDAERFTHDAAVRAGEPVTPASPFQVGGAGRIVGEKSLKLGEGLREGQVGAVENVHDPLSILRTQSIPRECMHQADRHASTKPLRWLLPLLPTACGGFLMGSLGGYGARPRRGEPPCTTTC